MSQNIPYIPCQIVNFYNYGNVSFYNQIPQNGHDVEQNSGITTTMQSVPISTPENVNSTNQTVQEESKPNEEVEVNVTPVINSITSNEDKFIDMNTKEISSIVRYYEYMKEWTNKTKFKLIYSSDKDELNASTFNAKVGNKENVMIIVFTSKNYIFGSYHSKIPEQSSMISSDSNHFAFSFLSHGMNEVKKWKGSGVIHCQSNEQNETEFDVFRYYSVFVNNKALIYSTFDESYEKDTAMKIVGRTNSKFNIIKVVALECIE